MGKRRPQERWERGPEDESGAAASVVSPEYIHFSPLLTLGKPAEVVSLVHSRWLLWCPHSCGGRSLSGRFSFSGGVSDCLLFGCAVFLCLFLR